MNLFAIIITKRLNIRSAGKLSEHDLGTCRQGQYFRSGLGCLKKRHALLPFLTRNQCSAVIFILPSHKKPFNDKGKYTLVRLPPRSMVLNDKTT